MSNFVREPHKKHLYEIILKLDQWFRRRCPLKDISYLQLWKPSCLVERNHLGNSGGGHCKEHFCEIILNLDQWFGRRCRLKVFLI